MNRPMRTTSLATVASMLVASAIAMSCSDGSGPAGPRDSGGIVLDASDATPTEDAGSAPRCAVGLTDCDGECVDLGSDFTSCGACGAACATGEVCSGGVCLRGGCPGGTTGCGGSCIDTTSDARHCGGCAVACAGTETCEAGTCVGCGAGVSFAADVQTIFTRSCLGAACHGGMRPAGDVSLEVGRAHAALVGVASSCADARLLVSPGHADESYLVHKIADDRICTGNRMPLGGTALSADEIATIRGWVCGGARND